MYSWKFSVGLAPFSRLLVAYNYSVRLELLGCLGHSLRPEDILHGYLCVVDIVCNHKLGH